MFFASCFASMQSVAFSLQVPAIVIHYSVVGFSLATYFNVRNVLVKPFTILIARGGVEDTRLEAKAKVTKKIRGQGQGQPFRGQTLSRPRTGMLEAKAKDQGHKRKYSPKKKKKKKKKGLEASRPRPRTSKSVLEAKDVLEDSTSAHRSHLLNCQKKSPSVNAKNVFSATYDTLTSNMRSTSLSQYQHNWNDRRSRCVFLCFYSAIFQLMSAKFQTFAYNSRTVGSSYMKF